VDRHRHRGFGGRTPVPEAQRRAEDAVLRIEGALVVSRESRISLEDYAMALIDELEHPHHVRRRFTVGY
jgi:putative NADH-flavin reductase